MSITRFFLESEAIAEKNIEIGSLKEQIRTLQNQISVSALHFMDGYEISF